MRLSDFETNKYSIYQKFFEGTQEVETSGRVQVLESGDLLVSNVREADAGLYRCIRTNEAGSVSGEAYLGVMGE